jgi:hypothetical protein
MEVSIKLEYVAVIRARRAGRIVAELDWIVGNDRIEIEKFIEISGEVESVIEAKTFLYDYFYGATITVEMKFIPV